MDATITGTNKESSLLITSSTKTGTSRSNGNSFKSDKCPFEKQNLALISNTITGFLANPIQSGYLLKFSQSEFNAENMIYVLEIDRFKDLCSDSKAWNNDLSYKVIDVGIEDFGNISKTETDLVFGTGPDGSWPSDRVHPISFIESAKMIWDTYLANSSVTQICMPARVLSNTIHRLEYLHLYGHKVFDETLIDPIKTLNADVRPRFLTSQHYKNMSKRLNSLYPLPAKEDLKLRLPGKASCMDWDVEKLNVDNLREVTMYDLFHDRILYQEFLKYSKRIYSEENVYLARAISMFKCYFSHADPVILAAGKVPPAAEDQAWLLFRFFIAPGSTYEVSGLSMRRRKEIMHKLAHPEPEMFLQIEKSIHRLVRNQYVNFSFTKEFRAIPSIIVDSAFDNAQEVRRPAATTASASRSAPVSPLVRESNCFGFF